MHIFDSVIGFCARYKFEKTLDNKDFASDEKSETEKENKSSDGKEKYYSRNNYMITSQFQLTDKDKFICFSTKLNRHPYEEDDIQPPQAL